MTESVTPVDDLLGATPNRRARRWLSLLLLLLAGLGAAIFFIRFVAGDDSPYYSAAIERADLTPRIAEHANLHFAGETALRSNVNGRIAWLAPTDGRIKASGALLARINASGERLDSEVAQASLQATDANVEAAQLAKDTAASRLARFESVWRRSAGRVPSLNEMEQARAEAKRTELALASAQANRSAAAARRDEHKALLSASQMLAPFSAVLVRHDIAMGQPVRQGQSVVTIAPSGAALLVDVNVPAGIGTMLKKGSQAQVRIDSSAETPLAAVLEAKTPAADGKGPTRLSFRLTQNSPDARAGAPAIVEVSLPPRRNVLLVPNAALTFDPASATAATPSYIHVLAGGDSPRRIPVTVGASDGSRTEVFSPEIKPGDMVAIGWRGGAL